MMGSVTEASPVAEHWDQAYRLGEATCSWFQPTATQSLRMFDAAGVTAADSVVNVGGGACRLVDELVARGFQDVTVLDVSAEAARVAQDRLSELAGRVRWLVRDVLTWEPHRPWRIWHDRAVLHFFSTPIARDAYLRRLHAATTTGSIAVIATFAPDGPEHFAPGFQSPDTTAGSSQNCLDTPGSWSPLSASFTPRPPVRLNRSPGQPFGAHGKATTDLTLGSIGYESAERTIHLRQWRRRGRAPERLTERRLCRDLRIVPTVPRHPLRSRRFAPATSAQSCPSRLTQSCG